MRRARTLKLRFRSLLRRSRVEKELDRELRFHLEQEIEEQVASGLDRDEARRRALKALGGRDQIKEQCRDMRRVDWIETLIRDIRYGLRTLRRQPTFTFVSVLILGLGIGLATSMFTIVSAIGLRAWEVKDPARVFTAFDVVRQEGRPEKYRGFTYPHYIYLRDHATSISGLAGFESRAVTIEHAERPARAMFVSANYFSLLGADAIVGRTFVPEEDVAARPENVAVLGHGFWRRQWGGDPSIVGKRIDINRQPYLVVGVTSPGFTGTNPEAADVWLPMSTLPVVDQDKYFLSGNSCCIQAIGRYKAGTLASQAQAELTQLSNAWLLEHGEKARRMFLGRASYLAAPDRQAKAYPLFGILMAGVLAVLLVACTNVSNLLLALAAARGREIGVRLAMGASRARIVRQLLTESLLLGAAGGALGVALAAWLPGFVMQYVTDQPLSFRFVPDGGVLLFALAASMAGTVVFGLAPALHATRGGLQGAIRSEPQNIGRAGGLRLRGMLLGTQVALCCVLLAGAALLLRAMQRAQSVQPGFAVEGVAAASFDLRVLGYKPQAAAAFAAAVESATAQAPGVKAAAWSLLVPLGNSRHMTSISVHGREPSGADGSDRVGVNIVSPGFLRALQIPLVRGRDFTAADANGPRVAIINETMARAFWPGQDGVGQTFRRGGDTFEVVGVMRNSRMQDLLGPEQPGFLETRDDNPDLSLIVRTDGDLRPVLGALPQIAARIDPKVHVRLRPLRDNREQSLFAARLAASIAWTFGLLALGLAAAGIYGIAAYAVLRRTREIGVRMALGATRGAVTMMVLGQNARVFAAGTLAGIALAVPSLQGLRSMLYGLSPLDPAALALGLGVLAGATSLASLLPARRAAGIDPAAALRQD